MSEWKIYSLNGVEKAIIKELELHDEWMAESYLTVTVKSAEPVSFAIGDYIDYRGERYCINYDPSVLKKARRGTYGEGFVYDNIKFASEPQSKIVGCDFTDLVLDDNQMHYTGLPTFPFYCETVDDLLDRVQACLEELYPGQFTLIGLNTVRNAQRGLVVGRQEQFIAAYKQYVDPTGAENTASYGKTSVALTVDNITCWEAITKINSDFGLNFIMRGKVVIAGVDGVFTPSTFKYGKGNGLYEIERISEQDQQVITRLKAYGSEDNIPNRYYAELNLQVFAHVEEIDANYATSHLHYATFYLDLDFNAKYFTDRSKSYPGTTDRPNYIIRMRANDITVTGYVSYGWKEGKKNRCYIYSEYTSDGSDDRDETNQEAMNAFSEAIKQGDTVYFVGGIKKEAFPLANQNYATENLPNNMAVSRLMLPGFPNKSLYDWVKQNGGTDCNDATGQATIGGFTGVFSKDKHRPWIQSMKSEDYGVRPGNIYFDGSDNTDNIHPTLEGMTVGGVAVDVISSAEQITDNGVFGEGKVPNFTITLPNLGFDLASVYEDGASIDMKDGMCGARSFKMAKKPVKKNNKWECEVERVKDDSLDLWFPYNDFQIKAGDHYVLTGIKLPDEYVNAAAERLFYAAIEVLQKNDTTQFTYQPRIDELWMARQHDAAIENNTTSLHDTIHAGDVFLFEDDDLGIDEGIIIDVLTIREGGAVPTYEVTLRNEKQVSSIQRMIDKAISGNSVSGGGSGGGGGYTSRQIQSLIENYGGTQFLSRINNDTAQGRIEFLKGLVSTLQAEFGTYHREHAIAGDEKDTGAAIMPNGTGDFIDLIVRGLVKGTLNVEDLLKVKDMIFTNSVKSDGARQGFLDGAGIYMNALEGLIEADGMNIRGFMRVMELVINRLQLMESDYSFTEGDTTERVDFSDNGQRMVLTMHKEHDNDHTPFYPGDILYAKINDLLDHGTYYTSWVKVISVDQANNTIKVAPWVGKNAAGDVEVPGGVDFTFLGTAISGNDISAALATDYAANPNGYEKIINLTRHGNVADGLENGDDPNSYSASVLASQKARQQAWVLSTTDKRLSFFWNVDKPIIEDNNYALCLGILPDLANLPSTRDKSMPSLYVNTIFYDHHHAANYPARIVKEDRGQWVGNPTVVVNGQTISEPYHFKSYTRQTWLQYRNDASFASLSDSELHQKMMNEWKVDLEVSRVWNNGILWECLVDTTTQEPSLGCTDWKVVSGNNIYNLKFYNTNSDAPYGDYIMVRPTNINIPITPKLTWGMEDVSAKVVSWQWNRIVNNSVDSGWSGNHATRNITLVTADMPTGWGSANPAIFECVATIVDTDGEPVEVSADVTI